MVKAYGTPSIKELLTGVPIVYEIDATGGVVSKKILNV
jgi:hypothetical protein